MDVFGALASYHRRRILSLLRAEAELPTSFFLDRLGLSQPGVSKHLKCLLDSGLIRARGGLHRRVYRINAPRLAEVDAWLDDLQPLWPVPLGRAGRGARARRQPRDAGAGRRTAPRAPA